jgi:hypothetical protein
VTLVEGRRHRAEGASEVASEGHGSALELDKATLLLPALNLSKQAFNLARWLPAKRSLHLVRAVALGINADSVRNRPKATVVVSPDTLILILDFDHLIRTRNRDPFAPQTWCSLIKRACQVQTEAAPHRDERRCAD